MNRPITLAGIAVLFLSVTGCAHGPKSYDVLVTNRLSAPITVWLTQAQPPYEVGFAPPEELALTHNLDEPLGGRVVPPGLTAEVKNSARIKGDNRAVLRVYRADHLNAILAISIASPDRVDVPLTPGTTDIDVVMSGRTVTYQPHTTGAPPAK